MNNRNNSKDNDKKAKLEQLQEQLKLAIKEERYEDAAKLRDEIKKCNGDDLGCIGRGRNMNWYLQSSER